MQAAGIPGETGLRHGRVTRRFTLFRTRTPPALRSRRSGACPRARPAADVSPRALPGRARATTGRHGHRQLGLLHRPVPLGAQALRRRLQAWTRTFVSAGRGHVAHPPVTHARGDWVTRLPRRRLSGVSPRGAGGRSAAGGLDGVALPSAPTRRVPSPRSGRGAVAMETAVRRSASVTANGQSAGLGQNRGGTASLPHPADPPQPGHRTRWGRRGALSACPGGRPGPAPLTGGAMLCTLPAAPARPS